MRDRSQPFTKADSDGCELISPLYKKLTGKTFSFHNCCVEHDRAYYHGGSHLQRLVADRMLRDCVTSYGGIGYGLLANAMYFFARVFGSPKMSFLPWSWDLK